MSTRGTFIVLDGGEGSGKSSVLKALLEHYGEQAVGTREPGGSPFAEKIRELILSDYAKDADAETLFSLFWAARRDHVMQMVIPTLAEGKLVLCDRFDSSTYAYQLIAQEQTQLMDLFWRMREHYLQNCMPDAYVLLDVPVEIGLERAKSRGEALNHLDKRALDFHQRVRAGLREFVFEKNQNGYIVPAQYPFEYVLRHTIGAIDAALEKNK